MHALRVVANDIPPCGNLGLRRFVSSSATGRLILDSRPLASTAMHDQPPPDVRRLLDESAARLARGLASVGPINNRPGAPCHEINAVLALMQRLKATDPDAAVHATGTLADRQRVDLIGITGKLALAVVAARDASAAVERLTRFAPALSEVGGDSSVIDRWYQTTDRWVVALETRFADVGEQNAWAEGDTPQDLARGSARLTDACPATGNRESWMLWEARRIAL